MNDGNLNMISKTDVTVACVTFIMLSGELVFLRSVCTRNVNNDRILDRLSGTHAKVFS